jgi:hypothetical protein
MRDVPIPRPAPGETSFEGDGRPWLDGARGARLTLVDGIDPDQAARSRCCPEAGRSRATFVRIDVDGKGADVSELENVMCGFGGD